MKLALLALLLVGCTSHADAPLPPPAGSTDWYACGEGFLNCRMIDFDETPIRKRCECFVSQQCGISRADIDDAGVCK